ncbi:hypothetical protein MGN70_012569 [Eutypa lata]|nr:hypothetical protein MGN70_012569 [Eutypa lata]
MRGVAAKIGTSEQDIVLLPWAELNNTWIYDQDAYCDSSIIWNGTICQVRRGNYYLESQSTTFERTSDLASAGGSSLESQGKGAELGISKLLTSSLGGTDTFTLESTSSLAAFPVGIPRLSWDHGYTMLHAMGMGRNSTLLNALVQTGQISSRVWSVFWGRMWVDADDALDGTLVLGGYNQDQVFGANFTQPLDYSDDTGCWTGMKVHISSLSLNFRNGSDLNLLPTNTALDVCIVPQRQMMLEAPFSLVETFEEATGMEHHGQSYGLHWSAFLYDAIDTFDGDMTFEFSNGLQVRVPNSQFLVPYVDIDRNGSRVFNTSERELLVNGVYDQAATLGRYFLTAAYLMVDQDEGTFTLWQANPSSSSTLVPVMGSKAQTACQDGTIGDTSTSTTSNPGVSNGNPAVSDTQDGRKLAGGAVAGIAVGSVVAISSIGAVVFFLRRSRKQQNPVSTIDQAYDTPYNSDQQYPNKLVGTPYGYNLPENERVHELHDAQSGVAEMYGKHEARVYEMDGSHHSR